MAEEIVTRVTVQAQGRKYLLNLPEDMAAQITDAARSRTETWAVWIREAIRQRLERDNG